MQYEAKSIFLFSLKLFILETKYQVLKASRFRILKKTTRKIEDAF